MSSQGPELETWKDRDRRAPPAEEPAPDEVEVALPPPNAPSAGRARSEERRERLLDEVRGARPRRRPPSSTLAGLISFVKGQTPRGGA